MMSIRELFSSFLSSKRDRKIRLRRGIRHSVPSIVELLESRQMLSATQDIGSLRFQTNGVFTTTGNAIDTASPVQIGLVPSAGNAFKPLMQSASGVNIDSTAGAEKFVALGDVSVISGVTQQLIATGQNAFDVSALTGAGAAITTGIKTFNVGAESFTPFKVAFAVAPGFQDSQHSVADLGGNFSFAALNGDGFNFDGVTSFVMAGAGDKLQATIDKSLALRADFTLGGLALSAAGLTGIQYDAASDTLSIHGSSSFNFHGNTFDVAIGSPGNPGLTISNGQLTSFDFTSESSFQIGAATFNTSDLNSTYDAGNSTYTVKGTATVTLGANTLTVELGGGGSAGMLIANGNLTELGFSTNGTLAAGGLSLTANSLISTYDDATDQFTLNGTATFAFQSNTITIGLGENSTPGLVITAGSVTQIGGVIDSDVKIGGLTFKSNGLTTSYVSSSGILTVSGQASFQTRGQTLTVQLGSTAAQAGVLTQGLVITNGSLTSLDAAVTGTFTFGGTSIKANGLGVSYDAATSTYAIIGLASLTVKVGNSPSTLNVTFGRNGLPGMVIKNGSFEEMDLLINGDFTISKLTFTANALNLTYNATTGIFTAQGGAKFKTRGVDLDIKLGSTDADGVKTNGLVMTNGSLTMLDAAVTGGFTFSAASFTAQSLRLQYDAANSQFTINGGAKLQVKAANSPLNLTVTFGRNGMPGIAIQGGLFQQMNLTVDGSFSVSKLTFTANGLNLTYDASDAKFTATGGASLTLRGTKVDVTLGGTVNGVSTPGLIIQKGVLTALDASVTGGFKFANVQFQASSLRFTYMNTAGSTLFVVSGGAALTFKISGQTSNVNVSFGTIGKPGLTIQDGSFQSMALVVNSKLVIAKLTFNTENLALNYDAVSGIFRASGNVSFSARSIQFNVTLGGKEPNGVVTDGLVIQNGNLTKFDATIDGGFQLSKVQFQAQSLRFTYQTDNGSTRFAVSGGASFSFTAGKIQASTNVVFGTAAAPGLVFVNGSFQSLALTINAKLAVSSVQFQATNVQVTYDATSGLFTAQGKLSFQLRNVNLVIELGQDGTQGLVIRNGNLERLDASVTSNFEFSKVKFSTDHLRVQWVDVNGNTRFELTGGAKVQFTAAGNTSFLDVKFGVAGRSGLVIENGSFKTMTLQVNGNVKIAGIQITAKNLTFEYDTNRSAFILFGQVGLSVGTGKTKVLDNVTATLGSGFDAPGIKIVDGKLERLDISVSGTINLGPLSATATSLRVVYTRSDGDLFITGGLDVTFGKKLHFGAGFPGRGLQINTQTGDVKLNGLRLSLGGIRANIVELKDVTVTYIDNGNGNFSINGSLTVLVGQVMEYQGGIGLSFANNKLSALQLTFNGNPGLQLGALQIRSLSATISGLDNGNISFTGQMHAVIPVVANVNLLTLDGSVFISSAKIEFKANAVIFNDKLLKGDATVTIDLANSRFLFSSNVEGLAGVLKGNASLKIDLKNGYFDASAKLSVSIPDSIPVVGGDKIASTEIAASYGLRGVRVTQVILPPELTPNNSPEDFVFFFNGDFLYPGQSISSPDKSYKLILQKSGKLEMVETLTGRVVFSPNAVGDILKLGYDGILRLYAPNGTIAWSVGTKVSGHASYMKIQNDGNLILNNGGQIGWQSHTGSNIDQAIVAAVVNIATEPDAKKREFLIQTVFIDFGNLFGFGQRSAKPNALAIAGLTEAKLRDLVNRTQVKQVTETARGLDLSGRITFLKVNLSPRYRANLDTNKYEAWVDYSAPKPFGSGRVDIASNGNPGNNGPQIVTKFSPQRTDSVNSNAKQAATPSLLAAANTVFPTSINESFDTTADLSALPSPTGSILAVAVNPATNSASIKFETTSVFSGTVTLFVDTHSSGFQGRQIDPGLFTADGVQTFNWQDVADSLPANYQHGKKLYFYLKVDDGLHQAVYSKYSAGFTAPQDAPTINVPGGQETMINQPLYFTAEGENAITITDPIEQIEPVDMNSDGSNLVTAIIRTTGEGTLHLPFVPSSVKADGNGSSVIELTGKASDINIALDGMSYTALPDSNSDQITVEVRRAESSFIASFVTQTINVQINAIQISGVASTFDVNPNGTPQSVFSDIDLSDVETDTIQSVAVTIKNYHAGTDFLSLNHEGIEDLLAMGVSAAFDSKAGILHLTGGAFLIADAERLLQNVEFSTTDPATTRSLTLDLHDNASNTEDVTEVLV